MDQHCKTDNYDDQSNYNTTQHISNIYSAINGINTSLASLNNVMKMMHMIYMSPMSLMSPMSSMSPVSPYLMSPLMSPMIPPVMPSVTSPVMPSVTSPVVPSMNGITIPPVNTMMISPMNKINEMHNEINGMNGNYTMNGMTGFTMSGMNVNIGNIANHQFDIKKLQKNLTDEEILVNLVKTNFISPISHIRGVSSKQNLVWNRLPEKYVCFKNDYVEYSLFNAGKLGDAVTNIKFYIDGSQKLNPEFKAEIILKINEHVICSKLYEHGSKIKLIDMPNIIVLFRKNPPNISVNMRIRSDKITPDLYEIATGVKYCLSFDPLYLDGITRDIILKKPIIYQFKTSSGVKITSMSGLYGVEKFTDLYDSVDGEFKFLYGDSITFNNNENDVIIDDNDVDNYNNVMVAI